jgi:hypothetical protein
MNKARLLLSGLLLAGTPAPALDVPGATGADGPFAPVANHTVDLAAEGEYDADKWAVIFRYSSVDIPAGVTVKFSNHPSRAPVVWLVDGDVTIHGTLNLNGANGVGAGTVLTEPGPGGFRGGNRNGSVGAGAGFGPGGARGVPNGDMSESLAAHKTKGAPPSISPTYGDPALRTLLGGSGGIYSFTASGGGGGGAILIAATGTINFGSGGRIEAIGGSPLASGGAVRLVAAALAGSGQIVAHGDYSFLNYGWSGGDGIIRLEADNVSGGLSLVPMTQIASPGPVALLWPAADAPKVRVLSVAGQAAPLDPRAELGPAPGDMTAQVGGTADIILETRNLPLAGTVRVRIAPRVTGPAFFVDALHESGDTALSTWRASFTVPTGFFALQARATAPATP